MAKQTVAAIFDKVRARLVPALQRIPAAVGVEAVNFTLEAFDQQAWNNRPWDKRKDKKNTRALLVKSGRLKRSIRVISTTESSVRWGTDVPYARVHNDGLTINRQARTESFVRPRYQKGKKGAMFGGMGAFRKITAADREKGGEGQSYKAYSFKMKQRQFLGDTPALRTRLKNVAKEEMQNALKGLK